LVIGLTISIIQATTQIQEQTWPFTFKLTGIGIIFLIGGTWIFNKLITLSTELFSYIATITG
jgi:flagellar biosynthetic protein FliQ